MPLNVGLANLWLQKMPWVFVQYNKYSLFIDNTLTPIDSKFPVFQFLHWS